ncbi:hypothetical protein HPG69_019450 [Diceros bicornis minor]|uniref:Uncharacterized protein n=1 Tax=Diceros bicornis minor TaxID=77932 RepID=A0A7J7F025_DICBM|nr:hypothetical protein HPG69_019450 [Diceros bicornis minor]
MSSPTARMRTEETEPPGALASPGLWPTAGRALGALWEQQATPVREWQRQEGQPDPHAHKLAGSARHQGTERPPGTNGAEPRG